MDRRRFIQALAAGGGAIAASRLARKSAFADDTQEAKGVNEYVLSSQKKPLAIAMWDFSWLLCHQRLDAFENWDKTLDELVERGYNAIRMDAFPHWVAPDAKGQVIEEYHLEKRDWKPPLWGNNYSIRVRPREALLEFLPKCYARGIHVGLATWFRQTWGGQSERFPEEDGLLRAWNGTLEFLDRHGLLDRVLYVDALNEYPKFHGFTWLRSRVAIRRDAKTFREKNPDAHVTDADFVKKGNFTRLQRKFYNTFVNNLLTRLKQRWPRQEFFVSLDTFMQLEDIDLSNFAAVDYHLWFRPGFVPIPMVGESDLHFERISKKLNAHWSKNRSRMIESMAAKIKDVSDHAVKNNIPCGNTEGWGVVQWMDHPALNWDFVKESGNICVDLALANGFKFICTSNFTHPQFSGIWSDVKWHQALTSRIRNHV